ncbi:MAG: sugar O-acetyltransferase [Muricauda sp.]|nr:sugar O-acetyltransferase [Allomuricauda sp.]
MGLDIFERLKLGIAIPMNDLDYGKIRDAVNLTIEKSVQMNVSQNVDEVRRYLSEIIGSSIHSTTVVFPPFHTNFGRHISLGKQIFINHSCSFLDLGGIVIEDDVMIGPRVNITSENHPTSISDRKTMLPGKVIIKQNVWIGAAVSILSGVTVGENSVVAAGAVVTKDVTQNVVVAGVPARVIKHLNQ